MVYLKLDKDIPGSELKPLIRPIKKGGIAPTGGKYDNNVAIRKIQEKPSERNPLIKGVSDAQSPYDFREFNQAEDVDGYLATTFRLTIEQCLKQGCSITGTDPELATAIRKQVRLICKASDTTFFSLIEDLITGLSKFNNAFLVLVRKEFPGSKFKPYSFRGKKVKPIAGIFYTEPQYMTPKRKDGRIVEWVYNNPDLGAQEKKFKPEDVFHAYWNKKGSDIFATPWTLPALDDIRMLRRLEEFSQMLISKHLFPIYQYKVGDKDSPAVTFKGGTSEVDIVEAQVGDLPQQGCIFTSHRHEIVAVDASSPIAMEKYLKHFDDRALSSCGLSAVDIGRGDTSNRGTAQVMNQSRGDRCTRIQKVLSDFFEDKIIFSLAMELGKDPFDERNEVNLEFSEVDTEEKRAQELHTLSLYQNDLLTHPEARKSIKRKAIESEEEWSKVYSNTTHRIHENIAHEASMVLEKRKAMTKNQTQPANQTNPNGKTKPKVAKNS